MPDSQITPLLTQIVEDVGAIKAELAEARDDIRETKAQATRTNGRTTAIEQKLAIEEAVKVHTATALARRTARVSWITPAVAAAGSTFGAVVLAHFF